MLANVAKLTVAFCVLGCFFSLLSLLKQKVFGWLCHLSLLEENNMKNICWGLKLVSLSDWLHSGLTLPTVYPSWSFITHCCCSRLKQLLSTFQKRKLTLHSFVPPIFLSFSLAVIRKPRNNTIFWVFLSISGWVQGWPLLAGWWTEHETLFFSNKFLLLNKGRLCGSRWRVLTHFDQGGGDKNRQRNGDVQFMQVMLLSSIHLCKVQVVSLAWKVQDSAGTSCRMSEI